MTAQINAPDPKPDVGLATGPGSGHDESSHGSEPLGPVDVRAWGSFGLGILLGLVVAACFGMAAGYLG